jgi:pimeloyl-ACP methyl ester carboxylesterase
MTFRRTPPPPPSDPPSVALLRALGDLQLLEEGVPITDMDALVCAARYPERVTRLIVFGALAPRLSHITDLCYNIGEWTNRLAHGAPRCTTHIPTRSACRIHSPSFLLEDEMTVGCAGGHCHERNRSVDLSPSLAALVRTESQPR